jgi:hypothetical protein
MKYGKLRIAWSVGWGIVCLLLIVLWVRSYWWTDAIFLEEQVPGQFWIVRYSTFKRTSLASEGGQITFIWAGLTSNMHWGSYHSEDIDPVKMPGKFGFGHYSAWLGRIITVPYWSVVLPAAAIGSVSWLSWRFSLRTLLIAMTLIAVGLGWAVYSMR